jgi:hypothetical protein
MKVGIIGSMLNELWMLKHSMKFKELTFFDISFVILLFGGFGHL